MAATSLLDFAVIAADRVLKTLAGRHVPERRFAGAARLPARRSRKNSALTLPD